MAKTICVDGVEYAAARPVGTRAVVVVDRGWVFAGDVETVDGRIRISRAIHVFGWQKGFAKLIEDPKAASADLRKIADVDLPADAELFRVPVPSDWGLSCAK
jgi:hypothetical protein